jgi:hypothetical protein
MALRLKILENAESHLWDSCLVFHCAYESGLVIEHKEKKKKSAVISAAI